MGRRRVARARPLEVIDRAEVLVGDGGTQLGDRGTSGVPVKRPSEHVWPRRNGQRSPGVPHT